MMSSKCVSCCCYCCLKCCDQNDTSKKYAGIEYDPNEEEHIPLMDMPDFAELPLGKSYHFPQPAPEFSAPLYPKLSGWDTITEQPKKFAESRMRTMSLPANFRSSNVSEQSDLVGAHAHHTRQESLGAWRPQLPVVAEVDDQSSPCIRFSLYYDIQRRTLTVYLEQASNLPAKDRSGTSDPFVVMYLVPDKEEIYESKVVYKTLDPIFDQSFEFHNLQSDDIRRQSMVFRIYDYDKYSKNDPIGSITVPLEDADLYGVVCTMRISERMETVKSNSEGDICLSLSYYPKESILKGVILKVTNLKKHDLSGLADPYVKVYLVYQGRRIAKWKTSIKRNTLVAVFNETFQFDLERRDINNISLEILVMDYDRFSRNDIMGVVLLGENVHNYSGRSHWSEMTASSQQSITQWHSIRAVSLQEVENRKMSYS